MQSLPINLNIVYTALYISSVVDLRVYQERSIGWGWGGGAAPFPTFFSQQTFFLNLHKKKKQIDHGVGPALFLEACYKWK